MNYSVYKVYYCEETQQPYNVCPHQIAIGIDKDHPYRYVVDRYMNINSAWTFNTIEEAQEFAMKENIKSKLVGKS